MCDENMKAEAEETDTDKHEAEENRSEEGVNPEEKETSEAETSVDFDANDCYEEAAVKADSESIAEQKEKLEAYLTMEITYQIDDIS